MRNTCLLLAASFFAASSFAQSDSAAFYLQKGLDEKTKGRRMEVVKHLENAYSFDKNSIEVTKHLGDAYNEVKFYAKAKEKYQQSESLANKSAENYKRLMNLSFNMRQWDDAIKKDEIRQKTLESAGFTILRFSDEEVLNNIHAVFNYLEDWIEKKIERQV